MCNIQHIVSQSIDKNVKSDTITKDELSIVLTDVLTDFSKSITDTVVDEISNKQKAYMRSKGLR